MGEKKNTIQNEISDIFKIISGEINLREKEEEIQKIKEQKVKEKKAEKRKKIASKEIVLEESDIQTPTVVQNIKLFEWEAPDRHDMKLENRRFLIILALGMLFILFLAILGNYFLMAAVVAFLFFLYVASTNKPGVVTHKITARGIDIGNRLYEWFMLDNFWFSIKDGQYFLIVETKLRFPRALVVLLGEADKDAIFVLLQEKVLYKDLRKQSFIDRMSYGEYIPFEEI